MATNKTSVFHRLTSRRVVAPAVIAATLVLVGQASDAQSNYPTRSPYAVTLEDDRGNALRSFRHEHLMFVLGYVGTRYDVRIENHGDRRVEAVLSVDGRDAISGDVGDYLHGRGYIVPAHGSILVDGFRRTLDETAAFRFSRPASSYSARMGTPENVGVIGVAFFTERRVARVLPPPPVEAPYEDRGWHTWSAPQKSEEKSPVPPSAAGSSARDEGAPARRRAYDAPAPSRLGTEYGESTWSPVTEIPFQRQDPWHPGAVATLRYDDADGLIARGIEVYPRPYWPDAESPEPDPFPHSRFAPAPP